MAVQGDAPFFPDTWLCDSAYGTSLKFDDCLQALRLLPDSTQPTSYSLNSNDQNPHSIPFSVHHGLCHISVEAAGPRAQGRIELVPYYFRGMAARVMQNCVVQKSGLGGFETYSLANLVHYILDRENFLNSFPTSNLPETTTFFTLTVSGPASRFPSPGNTDPIIPLRVAGSLSQAAGTKVATSDAKAFYTYDASIWRLAAEDVKRAGTDTWWQETSKVLGTTTYECDAGLGRPLANDCTYIEWNKLGPASVSPPSNTVSVGPGVVVFLQQLTCAISIASTASIILHWGQIHAAVSALIDTCVHNPTQSARGGRAYYGVAAAAAHRPRKREQLPGADALPPPVNITIFQQQEPWTNPSDELKSCTWKAVQDRNPISICKSS